MSDQNFSPVSKTPISVWFDKHVLNTCAVLSTAVYMGQAEGVRNQSSNSHISLSEIANRLGKSPLWHRRNSEQSVRSRRVCGKKSETISLPEKKKTAN